MDDRARLIEEEDVGQTLAYNHLQDPEFARVLKAVPWQINKEFEGLTLQASCPVCEHPNAIDVFIPTQIARFNATNEIPAEYVECHCSEDHKQPRDVDGCGRWGLIAPWVPPTEG